MKWYTLPIITTIGTASFLGFSNIFGNGTCDYLYLEHVCVSETTYEADGYACGDLVCWGKVECDIFSCANGKFFPCGK